MLQNNLSVTSFTLCVHECPMNIILSSCSVPNLRYEPLTLHIKTCTSSVAILIIFVYAFNRNKHAKLKPPSTFQTSDIELLSPKIET